MFYRQEFLKEASTMKEFNSYHVVRLLGVVSITDKPMVIMEYMANGDLKAFLRNSRSDIEVNEIMVFTSIAFLLLIYLLSQQADFFKLQKYLHFKCLIFIGCKCCFVVA